jgi:hypothetical protein
METVAGCVQDGDSGRLCSGWRQWQAAFNMTINLCIHNMKFLD